MESANQCNLLNSDLRSQFVDRFMQEVKERQHISLGVASAAISGQTP